MAVAPAEALNAQLSLLERLHILAQTESLALEECDWAKLEAVVSEKENLVADIQAKDKQIAALLDGGAPSGLDVFRRRAAQLVDRIRQVEEGNRFRLEALKTQSVQAAQLLAEHRQLTAYNSTAEPLFRFSKFAD